MRVRSGWKSSTPGSAAQEPTHQKHHCCTYRQCSNRFFLNKRRYVVERVAIGFGQLTSNLVSSTFSFNLRITQQPADRALRLAGEFFCNTFDLFTLHDSTNLCV